MNARENLHLAYVLHTRAFRDTSLIVEVFTPQYGRVSLLARGAKSGKKKQSLMLQPFRSLHVSWAGRGELPVLSGVEEAGGFMRLQGLALACGYYINELIYYLVPKQEPAVSLFAHYWPALQAISDAAHRESGLRQFELLLLEQIGYDPQLTHDSGTGAPIQRGTSYRYLVPDGPVAVVGENDTGGIVVSGDTLLDLDECVFNNPDSIREARNLMRALIHYHLDGRELVSRSLFSGFKTAPSISDRN